MVSWRTRPVTIAGLAALLAAATIPHIAVAQAPDPSTQWVKTCQTDPDSNLERCALTREVRADSGQIVAGVSLQQVAGQTNYALRLSVPLGMMLKAGIGVQIDDGQRREAVYDICFRNACLAEIEVEPEFVEDMKAGGQLVIHATDQRNRSGSIPVSLIGFTRAFDGAASGTAAAPAGQDDLNAALQARAAEARRRLMEQQPTTGN